MQFKVYAVRDEKASAFIPPVFFVNDAQAVRAFGDAVSNPQSGFAKHPEDYSIHCIGSFDDDSGKINGCAPIYLARAVDFLKIKDDVDK